MRITIVVGNPAPASRTRAVAEAVGAAIAGLVGGGEPQVIDLSGHLGTAFDPNDPALTALTRDVAASDFVVVASPTYKAAYTGLLKAFLDRYDTHGLAGVVAIPVMTGGSPAHSLAPDVTLRPLLVELGASVPTRSLYFMTSHLPEMAPRVQSWADANREALRGAALARRPTPASCSRRTGRGGSGTMDWLFLIQCKGEFPMKRPSTILVPLALLLAVSTADATGLATCDSGPESGWQPREALSKRLVAQGWKIRQIKVDGGCYEVYALDAQGARVEAYFHPVTLDPVPTQSKKK